MASHEAYAALFEGRDAPFAFVDLDALWSNAAEMKGRAGGKRVRVASKSVRCRTLLRSILDGEAAFRGLMTFTLAESLWLDALGFDDLLLAYPTADREGLRALGALESERPPVLMVDSAEQLDLIATAGGRFRVCLELDLSWGAAGGRVKVGAKRSPLRTPGQAAALAREVAARDGLELVGLMGYEAHIAGVGDRPLGNRLRGRVVQLMQRRSAAEIAERRAAAVAAVSEIAPLQFVNGGGTFSLHMTSTESAVTELTAGSGFYAPTLFDRYSAFRLTPAAAFALPVVRRPGESTATLLGGGYIASGAPGRDREPSPWLPEGLELDPQEGAGEVQTPVKGPAAPRLRVGDHVYMRHAKAGERCERFNSLLLVRGGEIVDEVPTYRGEGRCFL